MIRLLELSLVMTCLAGCSAFPNRKVDRPATYRLHVKDFEGTLEVAQVVKIEGKVGEYTIETESGDIYVADDDAP